MKRLQLLLLAVLMALVSTVIGNAVNAAPSPQDKDIHSTPVSVTAIDAINAEPPAGAWYMQNAFSGACAAQNSIHLGSPIFQYWCASYYNQYPGQVYKFPGYWEGGYRVQSAYSFGCIAANLQAYAIDGYCSENGIPVNFLYAGGGWHIQSKFDYRVCLGGPGPGVPIGAQLRWVLCDLSGSTYSLGQRWLLYHL